jgi:multidrug efflux pump subunit AcrB
LAALGTEAAEILERVPGLSEVTTPLSAAPDEVRVEIDRDKAHDLGIQPSIAEETIAWALRGFMFSRFHDRGREIPFLIEFDEDSTKGLATLRDLDVWSGQAPVELASFAALSFEPGSQQIRRVNGRTSFRIQAQVDDPARLSEIDARARRELASLELPRGYEVSNEDSTARRQQEEFGELGSALILALVLVFLLMGILFESVLLPFSVLFTIPFAAVGAIWCLFIVGTPLDSVGMIGVIILGGVVVNNGIVLIDRFHRLRVEGEERTRAILDGCGQRLRPVLMTALTTIFGLVPTTLEEPTSNAIDYRGLALVVAGGLAVSTVFTLWAVPLAYTLIEDATEAVRAHLSWALRRRARTPATAAGANPAPAEA